MVKGIYIGIGKQSKYREDKKENPLINKIKYFIIKWSIIITLLYFFLDDIIMFIINLI